MAYEPASIFDNILNEQVEYIANTYFKNNEVLLNHLKNEFKQDKVISRIPYIESLPMYKQEKDGIKKAKSIPDWAKEFLLKLSEANLGVYKDPFAHQIEAIECWLQQKDFLVATGTGSGKTECFMWPLLLKLVQEAKSNTTSWKHRGVRAIVMYPMNALVSDQISRLRRLIGDQDDKFLNIFHDFCGKSTRRPQFGMYTGRTPYPGDFKLTNQKITSKNKALAISLKRILEIKNNNQKFYRQLQKDGKILAKHKLEAFIENIENNQPNITYDQDAELFTRAEMQTTIPDIFITNYSMLEYTLFRPIENDIWAKTKEYLDQDPNNKLLFIIDEAHMYRGSSGGEVALLISRLFHKLQIPRSKVQFILTTASLPNSTTEDRLAIKQFMQNLTSSENTDNFEFIFGSKEETNSEDNNLKPISENNFVNVFENNQYDFIQLKNFWASANVDTNQFLDLQSLKQWMYINILNYKPFKKLTNWCRGNAVSLDIIAKDIFSNTYKNDKLLAYKCTNNLIQIASMAQDKNNKLLFPVKMHLLFKGLHGLYACTNPGCAKGIRNEKIALGQIFLRDNKLLCPECNSIIYELYQHKRCGALFFKGYINKIKSNGSDEKLYLWKNTAYTDKNNELYPIYLYIPTKDFKNSDPTKFKKCYLNIKSGFLTFKNIPVAKIKDNSWILLYYYNTSSNSFEERGYAFAKCPHCECRIKELSSFSTNDNTAFYNLVKSQFNLQSPDTSKNKKEFPNQGKKVLIFSDSRQRAAKIAKDFSEKSKELAMRNLLLLTISNLDYYKKQFELTEHDEDIDLSTLYLLFLITYYKYNLNLDIKDPNFNRNLEDIKDAFNRNDDKYSFSLYRELREIENDETEDYILAFLKLFAGNQNTAYDCALCWLSFTNSKLIHKDKLPERLQDKETLEELCNALLLNFLNNLAVGDFKKNNWNQAVKTIGLYGEYGLLKNWELPKSIKNAYKLTPEEEKQIKELFGRRFLLDLNSDPIKCYVPLSYLKVNYNEEHTWYKCNKCSRVTPYKLNGCCPVCCSTEIDKFEDKSLLTYWKKELKSIKKDINNLNYIDTEEHTAQISYKDQLNDLFSTAESYEMRFQDLLNKAESPVDILSCTTTMEVGIDIGSLVAVSLRNMPPMRENYQQRAGRAGRRGANLSTVITFCNQDPYDTLYFKEPEKILNGDPRKPWIDVNNNRLIQRHLSIMYLNDFIYKNINNGSLDTLSVIDFFNNWYGKFIKYIKELSQEDFKFTYPKNLEIKLFKQNIEEKFNKLRDKVYNNPLLYHDETKENAEDKILLDTLYDEGIIPTYSFPKNIVSAYLNLQSSKKVNEISRGLDIAISEYAPGKEIVVDKNVYKVTEFVTVNNAGKVNIKANYFFNNNAYKKTIYKCNNCGWFGLEEEVKSDNCPFCNNKVEKDRDMIRPWGFGLKRKLDNNINDNSQLSPVFNPLYSTVPEKSEQLPIADFKCVKMSARENQTVIIKNTGIGNMGFMICPECGIVFPNIMYNPQNKKQKPVRERSFVTYCSSKNNEEYQNIDIGFDFKTDILVLEIDLNQNPLITKSRKSLWLKMAAQTLAEAIRLAVCKKIDIDFSELITGFRIRNTGYDNFFIDIFLYDNLSSGAGYSSNVKAEISTILEECKNILTHCDCDNACFSCLKHKKNQHVYQHLDRFAALDLYNYMKDGIVKTTIAYKDQKLYVNKIKDYLTFNNIVSKEADDQNKIYLIYNDIEKELIITPDMYRKEENQKNTIYINELEIKYLVPSVIQKITNSFNC